MTSKSERCPYCSFDPTSLGDYCEKHRPRFTKTKSKSDRCTTLDVIEAAERMIACNGLRGELYHKAALELTHALEAWRALDKEDKS